MKRFNDINISVRSIDMNSIPSTLFVDDATIEEENDTANYVDS